MQFIIELSDDYVEELIGLTGYYFEDIEDVTRDDIEAMIMDLIDNA